MLIISHALWCFRIQFRDSANFFLLCVELRPYYRKNQQKLIAGFGVRVSFLGRNFSSVSMIFEVIAWIGFHE